MQSKERRPRIVGGLFIILMGVLALIHNMVTIDVAEVMWIAGLTLSAVMFLWTYTYEHEAWAAVGTYVTGAIALLVCLITQFQLSDFMIPIVVLVGVAIPFFAAWWVNPNQWGALIPAYIMVAIIPILYLDAMTYLKEEIIPAYVLFAVALPFLVGYYVTRKSVLLAPGSILTLLSIAFLAVGMGLSSQIITFLIPVILIVAGIYLVLRNNTSEMQKQQ